MDNNSFGVSLYLVYDNESDIYTPVMINAENNLIDGEKRE